MKKVSILIITVVFGIQLMAQDAAPLPKNWKTKLETNLGFSQTALSNWAAGGENTLATNGLFNYFADYTKGKFTWNNYLGAAYGIIKQESFTNWRKADDKLNFNSKAGIYAWKNWDYTALVDFKTQFSEGYKYGANDSRTKISNLFAPAYLQASVGLNYKPADYFSLFLSPIGTRFTFVNDTALSNYGAFGVDPGKSMLFQAGASLNAMFKKDLFKNINLMSKLDLFSNYLKNPENIIVNWENLLQLKVNKYISTSIGAHLIYDDNIVAKDKEGNPIGPQIQLKEGFTVGFAYTFAR
jgi:hypothetical protein